MRRKKRMGLKKGKRKRLKDGINGFLPWLWEEEHNLEKRLAEIEATPPYFYHYGLADRHAGMVHDSIRKEADRLHKIMEVEHKLEEAEKSVQKHRELVEW